MRKDGRNLEVTEGSDERDWEYMEVSLSFFFLSSTPRRRDLLRVFKRKYGRNFFAPFLRAKHIHLKIVLYLSMYLYICLVFDEERTLSVSLSSSRSSFLSLVLFFQFERYFGEIFPSFSVSLPSVFEAPVCFYDRRLTVFCCLDENVQRRFLERGDRGRWRSRVCILDLNLQATLKHLPKCTSILTFC